MSTLEELLLALKERLHAHVHTITKKDFDTAVRLDCKCSIPVDSISMGSVPSTFVEGILDDISSEFVEKRSVVLGIEYEVFPLRQVEHTIDERTGNTIKSVLTFPGYLHTDKPYVRLLLGIRVKPGQDVDEFLRHRPADVRDAKVYFLD